MKKAFLSVLILCLLMCSCILAFTSCNEDSKKSDETTSDEITTDETSPDETPSDEHTHIYENGKCTICSEQQPYEILYVSNGDGTCYVDKIVTYPEYEQEFTLKIPEKSPDGDTVTAIRCDPFAPVVPKIIAAEDFEKIKAKLQEAVDAGEIDRFYIETKVLNCFIYRSLSELHSETAKEMLLIVYPFVKFTDFYQYDVSATVSDISISAHYLQTYADYTVTDLINDYHHLESITGSDFSWYYENVSFGTNITAIEIPSTVEEIDFEWLQSCYNLKELIVPSCIKEITDEFFIAFSELTKATLPEGITSIGNKAFNHCQKLEAVTIPSSVTNIGSNAFNDCDNLKNVYYIGTADQWSAITIDRGNSELSSATIHYYSETQPTEAGNYWHYIDGIPTAW